MADEPNPQHSPIFGNAEYEAAIDTILQKASSRIRIFDHTLGTGYNSSAPPRIAAAIPARKPAQQPCRSCFTIPGPWIATVRGYCNLLRTYGHAISIHETHPTAKSVYDPFVIVDDRCFVHRFHFDEMRGLLALDDPIGTHTFIERFSEIWEASSPAVSATTLGL